MKLAVTLGLGVDVVKTSRFVRILGRSPQFVDRFVDRILHPSERSRYARLASIERKAVALSGSWACKEALFKTLDPVDQNAFQFNHWYRYYNQQGKPLIGNDSYNSSEDFLVSISHDDDILVATVLRQRTVDISSSSLDREQNI